MPAFTRRQYAGAAAATTITVGINSAETTCTLTSTTGFPSSAGVPFYVVIDPGTSSEEKCSATISGSTLTITRAQDDTTAVAHSAGATIYPVFTANDADEANELVAKLTTKGDLLVTTGSALNRLAVGTNAHLLTADSASTNGVKWALSPETDLVTTKGDILVATAADTLARQGVGADGSVLMADSAQTNGIAWSTAQTSSRNAVINGGFDVWQRGTTFNAISNTNFCADRWWVVTDATGTVNITQQAISSQGLGFTNCLRAERSAGTARWVVGTNLETSVVNRFKGKTVVMSFYVRKGSAFTANLDIVFGTKSTEARFGSNVDVTATTIANASINTTTFTRFTTTLAIPSGTAGLGFSVEFAAASQAGAANAFFEITGVQLEVGAVATPFEFEDYGTTLSKCERYYQKFVTRVEYNNSSTTSTYIDWQFKTSMRATPTVINNGGAATVDGTTENRYYAYRTGGNTVAIGAGSTAIAEL